MAEDITSPEAPPADYANTSINERPLLMIGGLDIVGSRWQAADLTPLQRDTLKTKVTLDAVNSVDNSNIYFPTPFDPGETRNGSQSVPGSPAAGPSAGPGRCSNR